MPLPTNSSNNWCFHCASAWSSIPSEMQQVVRNLLEVRRSVYPPKEFVTNSCTRPKNIDSLARQSCLYSYCQTLILTDHETGSAFTLRGCAENFGAIEVELLRRRGDNTCKRC
uniref:Uncharacterized protein n=1 Tax=Ditylenchus dipsaci TaxID=166011 RepID=A0A915CR65_9BILA